MPACTEFNSEVVKEGLDTLKDYVALKTIPTQKRTCLVMPSFQPLRFPVFFRLNKVNLSSVFNNIYWDVWMNTASMLHITIFLCMYVCRPHLQHMEVPGPGIELPHSCSNPGSLNPLHQARDRTRGASTASRATAVAFLTHCATGECPIPISLKKHLEDLAIL